MANDADVNPCINLDKRNIYWFTDRNDSRPDTNNKIRLILVHFLIPYCDMTFAKGKLNATKLIKYIRFTHIIISAEKFNDSDLFGSATIVIFAISCIISCDVAATIITVLFSEKLIIIPPCSMLLS